MYNGCPFYYNALKFNIYNPKIIPSTIQNIIYNISSGIFNSVPFADFTNDKGIVGDYKLTINYQL